MGFVMGNILPCFWRESNSALNLSFSDSGTFHGEWTTDGTLGGGLYLLYTLPVGILPIKYVREFLYDLFLTLEISFGW